MATSKLFKKVPTTVPNRSGFNMSHNNFFSAPVGTLVPNFIDFLIPGDEIDLSSKTHVQLPPMATDFYGRVEAKEEAFFVPARILFGGWKDFYVNPVDGTTNPSNIDGQLAKYLIGANLGGSFTTYSLKFPVDHPSGTIFYLYFSTDTDDFRYNIFYSVYDSKGNTVLAFDGSQYLEWYNRHQQSGKLVDAAIQLKGVIGDFWLSLINSLGDAYSNGDTSILFDSPDTFFANYGAGTLADYLGFKVSSSSSNINDEFLLNDIQNISIEMEANYQDVTPASGENSLLDIFYIIASSGDYNGEFYNIYLDGNYEENTGDENLRILRLTSNLASQNTPSIQIPNILPFMAYHKIYDDWYRAPQIQQSLFKRNVANQSTATSVANMPWITSGAEQKIYFSGDQLNFANGHSLFDLHQRNWQKDYFTSATPEPQAGEASSVRFDIENDSGEFTIASLRAANALQQWLDRNNIGGFRYGDMIYAQYGVYPSDAITDRAIYLGSSSTEVYNKSIYQQSGDGGTDTNNPFNAIGSKYSNPTGIGQGNFCNNYKVTEAGFVIKIFSLVPQAYYSTGVRRFFMHNDISDIAFPVLAGVGDQPIYGYELTDTYSGAGDRTVFGYVQRYADYKFIDDQVHGLLRDGESLDSFALQRSFSSVPQLGSDFLEIPRDYLDQVSATSYKLSQYGCWVNCYNDYRKSSTLPAYSIPTLEDMKGHTVMVDKGGTYLA